MSKRYFQKADASKPVVTKNYTFTFEPSHRNMASGGQWGILELDSGPEADALAKVARDHGVFEVSADDATKALQKKSTLNINLVSHKPNLNQENVGRVEVKSDGATSSVETFDELMGGGDESDTGEAAAEGNETPAPEKEETAPEPEKEPETEKEEPTLGPEPTIDSPAPKKRRGRPKKKAEQ